MNDHLWQVGSLCDEPKGCNGIKPAIHCAYFR
ncbi:hypothetical protein N181_24215 [Sinorhizobium fredii USDA 205]|nr:hypothetical protein N181_24215 [Sinorhizobium fredii USDA 205]